MPRMFTREICFLITEQMYADLKKLSKKGFISVSHLIRTSIREFLESELNDETGLQEERLVNNEERKED
jgi:Arc/MetJ-type ribon-helix-helix transcriptional regulator